MKNQNQIQKNDRRGAAMVEFAFVALPMFMLMFALIEFSRVCMMTGITEDACYQACRDVIVPGAVVAEGVDEGNRILGILGTRGASVTVVPRDLAGTIQADIDGDTVSVQVNVSVPMNQNLLFLGRWTSGIVLQRSCTMTTERWAGFFDGATGV